MKTLILTAALSLVAANAAFANEVQPQEPPRCWQKTDVKQLITPFPMILDSATEYDLLSGGDDVGEEPVIVPTEVTGAFLVEVAPVDEMAGPVSC